MPILFNPPPVYENGEQKTAGSVYPAVPVTGASQRNLSLVAATQLTPPSQFTFATVMARTAAVNYTLDGTTPSATVGFVLAVGVPMVLSASQVLAVKFLSATGTLDVEYSI